MEQVEKARLFREYDENLFEYNFIKSYQRTHTLRNFPMRENPNDVDQFLRYMEASRVVETLYARALRKMVRFVEFRTTRVEGSPRESTRGSGSSIRTVSRP
jgi:hypothetical protein